MLIDKTKPTVRDIGRAHAGAAASHASRTGSATRSSHGVKAKLVITRYHRHVATKQLGMRPTGRRLVAAWHCSLHTGTYSWRVVAVDPAGNRRAGKWHFLVVYPGSTTRSRGARDDGAGGRVSRPPRQSRFSISTGSISSAGVKPNTRA